MGGVGSGRPQGSHDLRNKKRFCLVCGEEFTGRASKKYCQPSCNSMAWLMRKREANLIDEIAPARLEVITGILKAIEGFDEYEAEYFFKALAKQSHPTDIDNFSKAV